ncbi:MAG: dihydrolipoamide acetyltransferase family protein [Spirochaetota bacterium]
MAAKVIIPKQGLQMTEVAIVSWKKKEGDYVHMDEPLFEMETDKTTVEVNSPYEGVLLKILKKEGEIVPVATPVAVIGGADEKIEDLKDADRDTNIPGTEERLFITPRARTLVEDYGLDPGRIKGTAPQRLIIERDVELLINEKRGSTTVPEKRPGEIIPVTRMRKAIARRMMESLRNSAQASHSLEVCAKELMRLKEKLRIGGLDASITALLIKITAQALSENALINSTLTEAGIVLLSEINVGFAVAAGDDLFVPVVKNANLKTVDKIHAESMDLIRRAGNGTLSESDLSGGTFTISNLGMFGIDRFTAIVNQPESAILAVGSIKVRPFVKEGRVVARPTVFLSLTYDHRVIDGVPAARFLLTVGKIIENPYPVFC